MTIPFQKFFDRLQKTTPIQTQMDLASALQINRSAVTQAKVRNAVPEKWILALSRKYNLSPDWLQFGKNSPYVTGPLQKEEVRNCVYVPHLEATVCAGGGSFTTEATQVDSHPFPESWLRKMGTPNAMVFMDVIGDSMEPQIQDGDMILIDQANTRPNRNAVFAVGVDDAIYIKRIEQTGKSVILHSDNPQYSPMQICGDELNSLRIIGKVVWLCRDFRIF